MRPQNCAGFSRRLLVEAFVFGEARDVRLRAEFAGRLEYAIFGENGIDIGLRGHAGLALSQQKIAERAGTVAD